MIDSFVAHIFSFLLALAVGLAGYVGSVFFKRFSFDDVAHSVGDLRGHFSKTDCAVIGGQRLRQLTIILSAAGVVSLANIMNIAIVAGLLLKSGSNIGVVSWAFVIALMAVFHSLEVRNLTEKNISTASAGKKIRRILRNVTIFGALWGAAGFLFIENVGSETSLIVIVALVGTAAGGAAAMAILPPAALLFVAAIGGPVLHKLLTGAEGNFHLLAYYAMALIFVLGAVTASVYDAVIKQSVFAAAPDRERVMAEKAKRPPALAKKSIHRTGV